ncbi:MAG: HupE/UreJ family protein, partial [Pseudomonadota bacterium]
MRSFGTLWWIAVLVLATPASAHLLNMSRATVSLEEDSTVVVTLELDILTTIGGRQAYFELSQTKDPLSDPDVLALLNALPDAIEINVAEYSVPLTISSIRFPADNQETFLDPLQWPRTTITLR